MHRAYVLFYDAAHEAQGDRSEACVELVSDFRKRGLSFVMNQDAQRVNP